MCGLPDEVFWDTLQTLIASSLLEVLGTPQTRRYGIHRASLAVSCKTTSSVDLMTPPASPLLFSKPWTPT
jgi:hypothetical protein